MSAAGTAHTPGPWAWFGNAQTQDIYLATTHSGRRCVMGFWRWGTKSAQPAFQENRRMVPASELVTFEVGDGGAVGVEAGKANKSVYRLDVCGIANADARLMAAAPELLAALQTLISTNLVVDTTADNMIIQVPIAAVQQAMLALARASAPPYPRAGDRHG